MRLVAKNPSRPDLRRRPSYQKIGRRRRLRCDSDRGDDGIAYPSDRPGADSVQLAETIRICRNSRSLPQAGRALFIASRARRSTANDADRLKKYLSRLGLDWGMVSER
ncbi:hypothetical protein HMP06_2188 [Sphingomonas sp. HMP6]|nr:hypothetical protein HMP06_2188 [Sphingomonas sp. HMP6]